MRPVTLPLAQFPRHFSVRLSIASLFTVLCFTAEIRQAALAGDNKVYPGSLCRGAGTNGKDIITDGFAAVVNNGFGMETANCPVVRDNTTNTDGVAGVWIWVYSTGTSLLPLKCSFHGVGETDGTSHYGPSMQSPNTGFQKMIVSVPQSDPLDSYVISCDLPSKSKIFAYQVSEH